MRNATSWNIERNLESCATADSHLVFCVWLKKISHSVVQKKKKKKNIFVFRVRWSVIWVLVGQHCSSKNWIKGANINFQGTSYLMKWKALPVTLPICSAENVSVFSVFCRINHACSFVKPARKALSQHKNMYKCTFYSSTLDSRQSRLATVWNSAMFWEKIKLD